MLYLKDQGPSTEKQEMEQKIEHSHLDIRGLSLHIAHVGKGELGTVIFLHGFPEIWYSWRHQMIATADAGFRAIAPDLRGHGLSDQPPDLQEDSTWEDLVADLLAILDTLSIPKAFIVGRDFGFKPAYDFALRHPDRVSGVITLCVPFIASAFSFDAFPKGFYMLRWREPGRAEADFARFDVKRVVRNIYILFSGAELPVAEEGKEIMDLVDPSTPLPQWFTEEDLAVYAASYEKSGFRFPLHMYRSLHVGSGIADPRVEAPAMLIMGEREYVLKFPGMEDYIRSGMVKHFVPDLDIKFIPEGTHFVQEQFPEQVNQVIINFLKNHI